MKVFVLFGTKLIKMFKRVSLNKATWAWMSLPSKAFSQLKDSIAEFIGPTLVLGEWRRVKYFHINVCKYYLVMTVLVERRMHSTVCYHVSLISKNQIFARRWWWINVNKYKSTHWLFDEVHKKIRKFKPFTFNIVNNSRPPTGRSCIEITCYYQ